MNKPAIPLSHPAYGLSDEFRYKILNHAEQVGVSQAAREFNVARRSIYRWKKTRAQGPVPAQVRG